MSVVGVRFGSRLYVDVLDPFCLFVLILTCSFLLDLLYLTLFFWNLKLIENFFW